MIATNQSFAVAKKVGQRRKSRVCVCVTSSNEMCRARRCRACVRLWLLLLGGEKERVDFRDKSLPASFESALMADGRAGGADDDELEAPIIIKI